MHDITSGNNVLLSSGLKGYRAGPGWDAATGWGSPKDAGLFLRTLVAANKSLSTPTPILSGTGTPTPSGIKTPTLSGTGTPTPSGTKTPTPPAQSVPTIPTTGTFTAASGKKRAGSSP
jgi:hypothetical protein